MFITMNKVEFGEWVRKERNNRDWSQADLARASGLYRSLINNIENGVSESAPKTLSALARAFGYEPQYLFELADLLPPKTELSPIKQKILKLTEDLPESDVEFILTLLEQRRDFYKKRPKARPAE